MQTKKQDSENIRKFSILAHKIIEGIIPLTHIDDFMQNVDKNSQTFLLGKKFQELILDIPNRLKNPNKNLYLLGYDTLGNEITQSRDLPLNFSIGTQSLYKMFYDYSSEYHLKNI